MRATPFRVDVPASQLDDLRRRLRTTRWADDFGNETWKYGVERRWLEEMVRYWAEEFDWRAQEAAINAFSQFRIEVDGVPVHFVHVRGNGPSPTPLILTHGWPWTFWDWKDVIAPLADPAAYGGDPADAFDVVVPSLPGYGFSAPLRTTGIGARRVAELWVQLMGVLGYERFAAAGGDWGAIVTAELGHAHSEHVCGVYLTLPMIPGVNLRDIPADAFAEDETWMAQRSREARPAIMSHSTVHIHDPQTLAYALCDSPWARRRGSGSDGGPGVTATATSSGSTDATSSAPPRRSTGSPTRSERRSGSTTSTSRAAGPSSTTAPQSSRCPQASESLRRRC